MKLNYNSNISTQFEHVNLVIFSKHFQMHINFSWSISDFLPYRLIKFPFTLCFYAINFVFFIFSFQAIKGLRVAVNPKTLLRTYNLEDGWHNSPPINRSNQRQNQCSKYQPVYQYTGRNIAFYKETIQNVDFLSHPVFN